MPLLHPPLSFLLQERIFFLLVYKMCVVRLRPCIDMHKGKVKQIVGSTLRDLKGEGDSALVTNFESDETAAEFANLHKEDGLMGGADDLSKSIAIEELFVGGVINVNNALSYVEEGTSHVIVSSTIERLKDLVRVAGKQKLV